MPGSRRAGGGDVSRFKSARTRNETRAKTVTKRQISGALSGGHRVNRHVEAFLEMLVAERGAAKNTLLAYDRDLNDFADFASGRSESVATASACPAHWGRT